VADHTLMTTILLLVSDPIVCSVLKETLEREGYTVLATGDPGQAVDRLKDCMPDLLITRTYVQRLTGHDAAMYLRTKCTRMRVLILWGLLEDERLQNREELQAFRVFPKPYTAAALLQEVKDYDKQTARLASPAVASGFFIPSCDGIVKHTAASTVGRLRFPFSADIPLPVRSQCSEASGDQVAICSADG
jgi:CheY-like chemotaxis protein